MNHSIDVKKISPQDWRKMAEDAHLVVFDEKWDKELERISFAVVMVASETNTLISYATVQELDQKTVHLQYGGAFPSFKGTPVVYKSFIAMLNELKSKYAQIVTLVENTNFPMLKFYMSVGFLVTGIRYFKEHTYLEHTHVHA